MIGAAGGGAAEAVFPCGVELTGPEGKININHIKIHENKSDPNPEALLCVRKL